MAVEITISNLTVKMKKLLDRNEIMYLPRLRTRINLSIESLDECLKSLKGLKGQGYSSKIDDWKIELQRAVYLTENDIDTFLARTALTRASPILYVKSLSDQFFLNNKMEKFVCKLRQMSKQIQEMSSKSDKKGDSKLQQSASKDGRSDQEQAKPSEDMGVSSSNNLGDSQSAKSEDFGEPNISNGRPESDKEQSKLPEDTANLSTNNLGQLVIKDIGDDEVTSEPNMSDGRPHQEKTKLPPTGLGDAESESREDAEYTSQQKVISEIEEEVDDMVGQVVSDRNSMTSPPLERDPSFLGDETKNLPGKRFLQRSETMYLHDEREMVGLEDKLRELTELTLNGNAKFVLISIVGRAGSGKTLLVRQIFNHSQTRQNFEKLAFISVSQNFKEREILAEIFQQVAGVKDQVELPFEVLQQKLQDFLAQKRYLIVLDDVHTPDVWDKIKLAFPSNSLKGSRVILTIRDANVACRIDPTIGLLHLRPLTDDESWKLFLTRVKMKEDTRPLPDSIKREILHKCQGLPLQILVLGGVLASRDPADWSKVLHQIKVIGKEEKTVQHPKQEEVEAGKVLENVKPKKQEEKETNAALNEDQSNSLDQSVSEDSLDPLKILALEFQKLSSNLRECFHYLCLFPKSREIRTRRLFHLWTAEGLLEDRNAAEVGERYIEELKQRNMIEVRKLRSDGKPKTCRVLDTLYDKFISDAADLGYHHNHGNSDSTSKSPNSNIRRFAERLDPQDIRDSNHLYVKDVRTYICFYNQMGNRPAKEVKYFIYNTSIRRGFGLLTVFDLEGVYKPVLPKTLGKVLPLLKYVGLRWTFLDSIPESVGNLQFLETLDVKHTNITKMPVSIWKTKELQHLYLDEISFEMSIRESSSCDYPTKLQTLGGLLIGNNKPTIVWLKRLTNIRKLGLTCHPESLEKLTDWISQLSGLRSLRLRAINEFNEPSDIDLGSMFKHNKELTHLYLLGKLPRAIDEIELPPKLTNLTLSVSQLLDDPMKMLGQLKKLKVLRLLAGSYIGKDMTCLQGGFPELEVLKLWMLKELENWIIEQGTMPKLKELEIRYCPKLNTPEGLEHLTAAEVTLTNMKEAFNTEVEECLGRKANKINYVFNPSWD